MGDIDIREIVARALAFGPVRGQSLDLHDIAVETSGEIYAIANAALSALEAAGYAIVPREPLLRVAFDDVSLLSSDPAKNPSCLIYLALGGRYEDGVRIDTRAMIAAAEDDK